MKNNKLKKYDEAMRVCKNCNKQFVWHINALTQLGLIETKASELCEKCFDDYLNRKDEFSVRCVYCKNKFEWNINIFTRAGERETRISGMCEKCFDKFTGG